MSFTQLLNSIGDAEKTRSSSENFDNLLTEPYVTRFVNYATCTTPPDTTSYETREQAQITIVI